MRLIIPKYLVYFIIVYLYSLNIITIFIKLKNYTETARATHTKYFFEIHIKSTGICK